MRKLIFAALMLPALAHKQQGKGIAGNKKPPVGGFYLYIAKCYIILVWRYSFLDYRLSLLATD